MQRQRWFGGKARAIADAQLVDEGTLAGDRSALAIIGIRFEDGGEERYFVPRIEHDEVCRGLLDRLERGRSIDLTRGRIESSVTMSYPPGAHGDAAAQPVRRAAADQSNTSILFGDELILKVFRRVEPGINPDVEIGRFLTMRGFTRVPALVADADYVDAAGGRSSVLMLQSFVPNQGNAWQAMLAASGPASMALADVLGRRTGELHEALASDADAPAFAPEPYSRADLGTLARQMRVFGARQLDLLRRASLDAGLKTLARQVFDREEMMLARFDALPDVAHPGRRIRCHGDYHLGQTLVADGDVFILDFEGEPARPLAERRQKSSPLRDVAGMLRSFAYAAGVSGRGPSWEAAVASAFLDGYRASANQAEFLPDETGFVALLDAFVLDKTLYELGYELNNRPEWAALPLASLARVRTPV